MKNRKIIVPAAAVLILVCIGFFLPDLTALVMDMKMKNSVAVYEKESDESGESSEDILSVLERFPQMKQQMRLRNGENMKEEDVIRTVDEILFEMEECGFQNISENMEYTVVPLLASETDAEDDARVIWICSWFQETEGYNERKPQIFLDDKTGTLLAFILYTRPEKSREERKEEAEQFRQFLTRYYPGDSGNSFRCTGKTEDSVFVFSLEKENGEELQLDYVIMEDGQAVFNM